MLIGGMVDNQLCDNSQASRVSFVDKCLKILQRAVCRIYGRVVGNVVAIISERRGIEREQPNGGDAQVLQVVELLRQSAKVADAFIGAVEERAHVQLID